MVSRSGLVRCVASVGVLGVVGALVASAGGAGAVPAAGSAGVPAVGESGGVKTQVFKTVNQQANASGVVTSNTLVTQVSAAGDGSMNVQVPVGTSSLRNLNGFGGVSTQGGSAVLNQQVKGSSEQRFMSTTDLQPIKVEVKATLDGKPIKPEDVVNKSGVLDVQYHITNTTAKNQPISYQDAAGNTVTQEMQTAVPFTGSMSVTLPAGFNEVHAPGANAAAGDGHNGTLVNYSVVLFPPLGGTAFPSVGASKVTIGYQSRISGATLPSAAFTFTPVVPYSDSTVSQTKDALATEASSGQELITAGGTMGSSLSKLTAPTGVPKLVDSLSTGATKAKSSLETLTGPVSGTDAMGSAKDIRDSTKTKVLGALTKPSNQDAINQLAGIEDLMTEMLTEYLPKLGPLLDELGNMTVDTPLGPQVVNQLVPLIGIILAMDVGAVTGADGSIQTDADTIETNCGAPCASYVSTLRQNATAMDATTGSWNSFYNLVPSWTWANVKALALELVNTALPQLLALPVVQNLFNDGPKLKTAMAKFIDGTYELLDQSQATVDAIAPAAEPLEDLIEDLTDAVPQAQQIGSDAEALIAAGPEQLTALGDKLVAENAPSVAQLDAMQAESQTGVGIPYGPATGTNVSTNAVYQLNVSGAGTQGKDNTINWIIGIILVIVAGGVGTALWTRRRAA